MTPPDPLEFLRSRGNEVQKIHLGLDRIRSVLKDLGNPHLDYPVAHVAGTNGKGSVAAFMEAMLRSGGYRTGLFTSPHLVSIQERIRVQGHDIPLGDLQLAAGRVRRSERRLLRMRQIDIPLTYFEFISACAFLHFAGKGVDVAVIEVGLGGRLDATNVVEPEVCIITGISLDHQDLLGDTVEKIAREKAGIIKPGVPVISGCRRGSAQEVVRREARRLKAPFVDIDGSCILAVGRACRGCYILRLETQAHRYRAVRLSLAGRHQARNAALAVCAVEAMKSLPLRPSSILRGLRKTRWPGRMDSYLSRRWTMLDGAHNPEGARLLRDHMRVEGWKGIHLVFGAMKDKDIRTMAGLLFPMARTIHLAPIPNSRGADPREIAKIAARHRSRIQIHGSAPAALKAAWLRCGPAERVVVTGSLYLVGALLPLVRRSRSRRGPG